MAVNTGTAKARHIGAGLRAARDTQGLTVRALSAQIGIDHTLLSRYETGQRSAQPEDVAAILTALGVNGEKRQALVDLAREKDSAHWLGIGMPAQKQQLEALLEFERTATHIVDVSPLLIPGLAQTSSYVRAMMTTGGVPAGEVETRVSVRIGRRDALQRPGPAQFHGYIGETALRQVIGGTQVMREQLQYLLTLGEQPNVELRVIPARCDWNPALEGPFVVVEFEQATPLVHLENRRSGLFLHEPDDVEAYQEAVGRVQKEAMSPAATAELIADVITELETTQ